MTLQNLFNDVSLYAKEEFKVFEIIDDQYQLDEKEFERLKSYIGIGTNKVVTYCHKCKSQFPFDVEINYIDSLKDMRTMISVIHLTRSINGLFGGRINTYNGELDGSLPPYDKEDLISGQIWYVEYYLTCTNDDSHKYYMVISLEFNDGKFVVRKIGQNPSMLTVKGYDFDKYKSILQKIKAYDDYKKADLSYADHFYVGAYAYLRRIFEKVINKYLEDKNDKKLHMDEKIDKIKDKFDPRIKDLLKNLYSILSVSIHELDEEESKEYYQYLKAIIDIQLEFEYTELEKEKQSNDLKSVLSKITNGIKLKND